MFYMHAFRPTRFGKYLLLEKIATGGMAQLYRAKITGVQGFEKLIAIKQVLPHLAGEEELVKSFIDEAKLAALLNHQNIVQIYDFGSMDGAYFISMEYIFGRDLRLIAKKSRAEDMPLTLENALYITSRVCSGLNYAHNLKDFQGKPLNLIHRDISPQNILITYEGDVKIVDFGIAKAASRSTMTQVGMIKGKVAYMSPEQAEGKIIDRRSDIFSTGILLYEMVTGKRMFRGDTLQILSQVREARFDQPEKVTNLPPKLCEILHLALAKEPERRYQSCGDMLADLEECIYQLSLHPTARGLSRYMKELFKEEIVAEEEAMREAVSIGIGIPDALEPLGGSQLPKQGEQKIATAVEKKELKKWTGKQLLHAGQHFLHTARTLTKALGSSLLARMKSTGAFLLARIRSTRSFLLAKEAWTTRRLSYAAVASAVILMAMVYLFWPAEPVPPSGKVIPPSTELKAAMAALAEDRFEEAVTAFEKVSAHEPSIIKKIAGDYARALRGKGSKYAETDSQKAKTLLLKAVALDPDSAEGYHQLGRVYVKLGEHTKAIEPYERAVALDPQFTDALYNLGYAYALTKDYVKAEEMYRRVVVLNPSYLDEALFNLAVVQGKQGKKEQSIENLERALKENPNNKQAEKYLRNLKENSEENE